VVSLYEHNLYTIRYPLTQETRICMD
jgi:hypothetical protein